MTDIQMPQFPSSYWRESVDLPSFPKLDQDIKTDVTIVGGGITGITAAYLLSRHQIQVTLLEAGVMLNGTTGHTTAKITAQHGLIYDEFINHFGTDQAQLYYQAAMEAKEMIEKIIEKHQIECEFERDDAYIFTNSEKYLKKLENEKRAYDQLGIPSELNDSIPLNLPVLAGMKMKDQAQFHPLKYLQTLIQEAVENGLKIFEHTTAIDIRYGKEPVVKTIDGYEVTSKYVIQASHFPFYDGMGFYPTRMYPERSYIIATKTSEKYPGGMYINAESPTRSIRKVTMGNEDLWLFGGENHKTGQGEPTYHHYEALQEFATKHFHITAFPYRWSAQDLTTMDKLPYIGPVTSEQKRVFVATGYRKWGMTNGTIAAKIIHDLIVEKSSPYAKLFTPSRFHAEPSLKEFMSMNVDVAKHLIQGKLEFINDQIHDLNPDEATITRINGMRTGVYKDLDNQLHAVDTTCKHLGCEVQWNSGDRTWDCPCHGSRYKYTGEVVEGPAKEPLNKVSINENDL